MTTVQEFPAGGLDQAKRCVIITLDECSLLLTQQEVLALESVMDVQPAAAGHAGAAGTLHAGELTCPVYSLDRDLNCLSALPARHRICAVLNHSEQPYALSCCEVRMVDRSALALHPMPKSLAGRSGPLRSLIVMDGTLLLGTSASALFAHLGKPREAQVVAFDAQSRRLRA